MPKAKANAEQKQFMPDLAWFEDEEPAKPAPDQTALIESLQKQVADLTASRPTGIPVTAPRQMTPVRPQLATEPDWKNLPDPLTEPEKYASEVHTRSAQALANKKILEDFDASQANAGQQQRDALWTDFQGAYPDYDDFELVEVYALKEARELAARGVDVPQYMITHKDTFFKAVAGRLDKALGGTKVSKEDVEDEVRTVGVFGGLEGGNKPIQTAPLSGGSMFDDLKKWQAKTGFHR